MTTYFEDRCGRAQGEQHMLVARGQLGSEDWPADHGIVYGSNWIEALTPCCDAQFGTNFECVECNNGYDHHTGKSYSWESLSNPAIELEYWIGYWTGWVADDIEIAVTH